MQFQISNTDEKKFDFWSSFFNNKKFEHINLSCSPNLVETKYLPTLSGKNCLLSVKTAKN